ncbi:MAG: flavodoxin family protein [Candidatus Thorarchaeota archaeon]|nr:flavodoxin family protein [Candidatus Thorarchaeota archaeon]
MVTNGNNRVLGIIGSPRKGGNTEILVDEVLAGAEEAGASITKVALRDLKISPCRACDKCRRSGTCHHDDDMAELLSLMKESNVWVLGTPIYWWGPTAQVKAFVDRWYGADQRIFQGKQIVLTIPMGGGDKYYARHTIGMFEDICNYLGMTPLKTIVAPGMNGRGTVREHPSYLETARAAGVNAVPGC